jgi:hypothetical protein
MPMPLSPFSADYADIDIYADYFAERFFFDIFA